MVWLGNTNKFKDELIKTANAMVAPGKGILAADESTGTIGKRLTGIKVENTRENRRAYRKLLFTSPAIEEHISGVILYEETLFETEDAEGKGKQLIQHLKDKGVIVGIKVDQGTKLIPQTDGELSTQGLTDLDVRLKKYYDQGARFSKWRAVITIDAALSLPSALHA